MRIDTFLEAKELYEKYQLCETVLKYLSDDDEPKGQKYLETLRMFVNVFPNDFMMFVHERMESVGMQFEELTDCKCGDTSEVPEEPSEPKEPKFAIGSKVVAPYGHGDESVGVVKNFDADDGAYYVVSDHFALWFTEDSLTAYTEPENPEEDGTRDADPAEGE